MEESFGEWWWCPECGDPIEVCASWGDCPNSQISKSHVQSNKGLQSDGAKGAATLSGLYNCEVCGQEKCAALGIREDCLTPPSEEEIKSWGADEVPRS